MKKNYITLKFTHPITVDSLCLLWNGHNTYLDPEGILLSSVPSRTAANVLAFLNVIQGSKTQQQRWRLTEFGLLCHLTLTDGELLIQIPIED